VKILIITRYNRALKKFLCEDKQSYAVTYDQVEDIDKYITKDSTGLVIGSELLSDLPGHISFIPPETKISDFLQKQYTEMRQNSTDKLSGVIQ
jgi:hypothetical protein